jgi:hypothetical protein
MGREEDELEKALPTQFAGWAAHYGSASKLAQIHLQNKNFKIARKVLC